MQLEIEVLSNIAKMVSDLGKAQAEHAKATAEIRRQWQEAGEAIKSTFETLAGVLAVGFGAAELVHLGFEAVETSEKLQRMTMSLGVSTQTLQTMQYVATTTGSSLEDATSAMTKLERAAVQAASGSTQQLEAFRAIGISSQDVARLMKDPDQLIQVTTEHLAGMADGSTKTAIAMELLGRGAAQNSLFINELGSGFDEAREQAEKFGIVLSQADNEALLRANESLDELQARMLGLGNQIGVSLSPVISELAGLFSDLVGSGYIQAFFHDLAGDVMQVVDVGGQLVNWLSLVKETFTDITGVSGMTFTVMRGDLTTYIQTSFDEWARLKATVKEVWVGMKLEAETQWVAIRNTVTGVINDMAIDLAQLLVELARFANLSGQFDLAVQFKGAAESVAQFTNTLKPATVDLQGYREEIISIERAKNTEIAGNQRWADSLHLTSAGVEDMRRGLDEFSASLVRGDIAGNAAKLSAATANLREGAQQLIADGADAAKVTKAEEDAIKSLTNAMDRANASQGSYDAKKKESKEDTDESVAALLKFQATIDQLTSKFGGPYQKAISEYNASVAKLAEEAYAASISGADYIAVMALWQRGDEALTQTLQDKTRKLDEQLDITGRLHRSLDDETRLLGTNGLAHEQLQEIIRAEDEARRQYANGTGLRATPGLLQSEIDKINADVAAHHALNEALRNSQQSAEEWAGIWKSAGYDAMDDFSRSLVEGGSAMESLSDLAKRTTEEIIAYFGRLAVINPLLNSIFGSFAGNGSMLPTLATMGSGALGGGTTAGGALNFASTAAGAQNSIMSPASWIMAGKNLWSGFTSGGTAGSSMFGTWSGQQPIFGAGVDPFAPGGAYGTFTPSGFAQGLGIAGGIYAGYNRFQNRYDLGTGALGGAAYGVGTYTLGMGAASMASGGSFIAGASALGPIGWVAAAAMILDMATGGGLFGTAANKFQFGQSDLNVTGEGASYSIGADYKGKKPLFGGSYHEWKTIQPNQDQIDAANGIYAAMLADSKDFARQFGSTIAEVAGGTFRQIFDKNGKVTSSSSIVNGIEYKGEDQKQFTERLSAESYTLDLKAIGVDITTFTHQFIKDADAYAKAVQDAANAVGYARQDLKDGIVVAPGGLQGAFSTTEKYQQGEDTLTATYQRLSAEAADLKNGIGLLTGQDSIDAIESFLREAQRFGESLGQTYQRLQKASQDYRQFVDQFKPQTVYVDDFEASLAQLHAQMLANQKQANDLAKAAGLQGAANEDLIAIQKATIEQQNQLVKQLEATAQSLAFSLGLTTTGSLSDVNAEIQRLQAKAGNGASAVRDFGSAMQDAAQRATDAMNLLLGNLSPLNDQAKLQKALEGLRQGSVSQEQVLQIGRRLYASSQAYNDLFAMVQQYAPTPKGSAPASGSSPQGLTATEQERLSQLLKEQAQLQKTAQLQQFQTLAQQVAELAQVKGGDWRSILKGMDASIDAFEKGLGLTDAQTDAMMKAIMEKKDSDGQNSRTLAAAINRLVDFLGGGSGLKPHEGTGPGLPGQRSNRDIDWEAVGRGMVREFNRSMPPATPGARNGRTNPDRAPSYVR